MDTSQFQAAMRGARTRVQQFSTFMKGPAGLIGSAVSASAAFGALSKAMHTGTQRLSDLAQVSRRTGASMGFLVGAAKNANRFGVEVSALADAMKDLTKNAGLGKMGDQGVIGALKELGINSQNFFAMNPSKQFEEIAKAVSTAADKQQAFASATKLLGESAHLIMPVLKDYQGLVDDISRSTERFTDKQLLAMERAKKGWRDVGFEASNSMAMIGAAILKADEKLHSFVERTLGIERPRKIPEDVLNPLRIPENVLRDPAADPGIVTRAGGTPAGAGGAIFNRFPQFARGRATSIFDEFGGTPAAPIFQRFPNFPGVGEGAARMAAARSASRRRAANKGNLTLGMGRLLAGRQDLGVQGAVGGLSGPSAFRSKREAAARRAQEEKTAAAEAAADPVNILQQIARSNEDISENTSPQ